MSNDLQATLDLQGNVHRRFNPLTGEWVLVSPHRALRPWRGQTEQIPTPAQIHYDPDCYLCPGNVRAGGIRNSLYRSTFVFDNDFAALLPSAVPGEMDQNGLLVARTETGICRVICYSPDHGLTLSGMSPQGVLEVVQTWTEQCRELGALPKISSVQIFENRGAMMGASNPHPHGQIWANETMPNELAKETAAQQRYRAERGSCLLCSYAALELQRGERLVCRNEFFAAIVPFWASWPFELLVLPIQHHASLEELGADCQRSLADILGRVTRCYDALFVVAFPYSMGLHLRPTDGRHYPGWHLHAHFYPPLLRSATVRKFMVGYEMLAGPQRDITPEQAAARLRQVL